MKTSLVSIIVAAAALGGCASLNTIDNDVLSYSQWPADRQPGTYVYERLPSQQANADRQAQLEAAARPALSGAGFKEVGSAADADVTIQLGARLTRYERSLWYDPFWSYPYGWGWGYGYGYRYGWRWGGGMYYAPPYYEREVAVLIRDRKTGAPLYETRASSEGGYSMNDALLAAMFEAALKDFPQPALNPRRVSIQLPP
jgi:hypothetical protein